MIVNASGRTDIPAFYMKWFMNRLKAGFFDVRNPFAPQKVSRISVENIDAFMFCTKNPIPLIPHLQEIDKPILLDVTVTGYHRDLEPNQPDKKKVIEAMKEASRILGKSNVALRYDPILLNERYTPEYHVRAFEKLAAQLDGYIEDVCFSLIDDYKNVRKHADELKLRDFTEEDYRILCDGFLESARKHHLHVHTCNEGDLLAPYGIPGGACLSAKKAYEMTGKVFKLWKARNCGCVQMVDVGAYNSCAHFCKYCYANFDEKQLTRNIKAHDPDSSLLIGELEARDEVKERFV